MDMKCRDRCLETASGAWVDKGVLATPWSQPPVRMTTTWAQDCAGRQSQNSGDTLMGCPGCTPHPTRSACSKGPPH